MLLRLLINIEGLLVRTVIPCYTYTCLDIAGWVRGDKGWSQAVPWRERKWGSAGDRFATFKIGGQRRSQGGNSCAKLIGGTGMNQQIQERVSVHQKHTAQGTAETPSYLEQNVC